VHLECISVCHVKCFWTVGRLNTAAIEEESDRGGRLALSFAKSVHELLQSRGTLDLEEDFIVVVGDLNIEMLALTSTFRLLGRTGASVIIRSRHFGVWLKVVFGIEYLCLRLSRELLMRFACTDAGACTCYKSLSENVR